MKFRYLVVAEDYTVTGTNSSEQAQLAKEWSIVMDCQEGVILELSGESKPIAALEDYLRSNPPDMMESEESNDPKWQIPT